MLNDQDLEKQKFEMEWDKQFYELADKYSQMELQFKSEQEAELNKKMEIYEKSFADKFKPSTELLNFQKIYDKAVKQKE